jgi:hypothetical protein
LEFESIIANRMQKPLIAITMGDPRGIGPEVVVPASPATALKASGWKQATPSPIRLFFVAMIDLDIPAQEITLQNQLLIRANMPKR